MLARSRILVVEDETVIALHTQMQLQGLGYEPVGMATTGEQAIDLAIRLHPDLVLMDIQLAGTVDGITAAQTIRQYHALPVVFVTAYSADDVLERALLSEPYGYILKPYSERELRTVLEMALYKHRTEVQLRDALQHTQTILDQMLDAVITTNEQGSIESFNKIACSMFDFAPEEMLGRPVSLLLPTLDTRTTTETHKLEGKRRNGSLFPVNLSVSETTRQGKRNFIALVRDMTQHYLDMEENRRLAYSDPLTGLPNRRLLLDRLKQAMLSAQRSGQHGALMFLDLDDFKHINDNLGHELGDVLLQQVAQRLNACLREGDSIARVGGDDFVVLLEALSPQEREAVTQSEAVASKLLHALGQTYTLGEHTHTSTASVGIVVFKDGHESMDALMKEADVAMYQAKAAGRNTIRFFNPAMQAAAAAHAKLEKDMRRGLAENEFLLHYQVQVDGRGTVVGVEALVRWNHAQHGMVPPGRFIPLAEETGLILPLGQWVLEAACAQLVAWSSDPRRAHWSMAVNVSALQFAQADFVIRIDEALRKTGANPCFLKLELTESMLVKDVEETIAKMNAIKSRGVSFSLDDFGTGYSSLTYLKRLPLAQLKIDQSFTRDILTDASDAVIARTVLALGHSLGLKVIAEGVETAQQRDFLAELGCDAFQGYYFGRPSPASDLDEIRP